MNKLVQFAFSAMMALVVMGSSSPANAKNVVADVDQIASVLQSAGYKAEIKESAEEKGNRYIRSSASGYNFTILMYGCDETYKNCKSVQFYTAFTSKRPPTLDQMNTYARQNRWGRVYLDKDGDPAIEFDLDLEVGGMSEALFLDNIAYWESIMVGFAKFVFGKE
ncbi:MAG: YbjN domain-containing protein [Sphingomonadales bacterium]|nr:YbjN domain-containing protein [Sphingomonadales bacterium]